MHDTLLPLLLTNYFDLFPSIIISFVILQLVSPFSKCHSNNPHLSLRTSNNINSRPHMQRVLQYKSEVQRPGLRVVVILADLQ